MKKTSYLALLALFTISCSQNQPKSTIDAIIENAVEQQNCQIAAMKGDTLNPRTTAKDSSTQYISPADWTSGFFPGSMWYMSELTGDKKWEEIAIGQTSKIEEAKTLTWHHDIGFIIECSFGNGLRLTGNKAYEDVIVEAARSLSTRFREAPQAIQSWEVTRGWQSERGWSCPVIIDNMMNLELLFHATELTGDSSFYNIAVKHANTTMDNAFRENGSCYHVVDYELLTGEVRNHHTAQGYAHESAWARGQAWAIYGYTVMYRYTKDQKYLDQAIKTFTFMKDNKNMPTDKIPYWDLDAPEIPNAPRDASAAAVIASALYEMSQYTTTGDYKAYADSIIESLSSKDYTAQVGTNNNFILMHSVGSIPHNQEIDVPLNYADYYYLEAVKRKRDIEKQ